jgi:hypothetical protein
MISQNLILVKRQKISILSNYPGEKEVLFKSNTNFEVLAVDVDKKTNARIIILDEIE